MPSIALMRVGSALTPRTTMREPGTIEAATSQNAAALGSPGTSTVHA
jgi:hypothetical protein